MSKILIAAVQLISEPNVNSNLIKVEKFIAEASYKGASLVLLPELFCGIFPPASKPDEFEIAEKYLDFDNAPIQSFIRQQSISNKIWLVAGSIPLLSNSKLRNTMLVFNPEGECVCRYDKIHLFKYARIDESRIFEAGEKITPFSINIEKTNINICPSICYDLRFPELYRKAAKKFSKKGSKGIDLILMPAAFTYKTGRAHWLKLLQARAIENQCYLLAAAQGGKHKINGRIFRNTYGHSMIIDPQGNVINFYKRGEGLVIGELNPLEIKKARKQLPVIEHMVLI